MLRDVFYYGQKPNAHPREKYAKNLADARKQSTTSHFWVINEYCDYRNFDWDFDFEFLPDEDVWAENHNNIWPSKHQKDSGTWLCPKQRSDVFVYRADVDPLKRKNEVNQQWKILENIDKSKWDFSWHPDPTDPPYIYRWGCKFFPVEFKTCLEYHVEGATEIKYMKEIVELLPNWDYIVENQKIDYNKFDVSWRPDPREPPYIYVWGNKWIDGRLKSTLEYHVPGATEKKYMPELLPVIPEWDNWLEHVNVDKTQFDFTWRPDPREPAYNYVWGNKYEEAELKPTLEYRMKDATQTKYMSEKVEVLPEWDRWVLLDNTIDKEKFDFTWRPDPREPAYIYTWGNKYIPAELKPTLEYRMPDATERKYMSDVDVKPQWDRWIEHIPVDKTRSQLNGFDFSWRPDPREPAYNYIWGNKFEPAEIKPTLEYRMPGATEIKYMTDHVEVMPQTERWTIIENIDKSSFDFSWRPDPREPALIYVFGNELFDPVKMPTVEYHCPDATEKKYVYDIKAKLLSNSKLFNHLEDSYLKSYVWLPDPDSPPYIYAWGNQWNKPEDKISVQFVVPGATEYKYMEERAIRKPCMDNWEVPDNIDVSDFDFSWEPSPADPPFVYQFGTQWQKTGGPRYVVEGATEIKYVSTLTAKALATKENWIIPSNVDVSGFDFSWHPDDTSPPYIYHFATQWALTGGPVYKVEGATEVKYVEHPSAVALPDKTNWVVPDDVDSESFDFSWHPYVEDQPYVYQFGTQHQKTGGPKYVTPGVIPSSPTKYIDTRILKSKKLPNKKNFAILNNYKIKDFDWSWHPDDTEEPYIYVFGNNLYSAEIMPTIEYVVPGAKQIKYVNDIVATLDVDMTNWEVPDNIDVTSFDFTWKPNPKDPPYVYQFGTQWQKTGGPRYVVPDAVEVKYVTTQQVKALPTKDNWTIPPNIDVTNFDFSWHPDSTSPPYIYHFATQWALTGGPIYKCQGAIEVKYLDTQTAIALPNKENWEIPNDIDVDSFDFSWHPYVEDQPYVYVFGTQHQKTGGPKYITPGVIPTSPVKYIDTRILKATKLPNKKKFSVLNNYKIKDFDYSWHPDETEEPYIYVFGNNQHGAEIMPTVEFVVPGAKQIKYVTNIVATLDVDKTNWKIPKDVDTTGFDFSWKPNPKDPPYIYQFGTQWQKTGGPRYVVPDATEIKYVSTQHVTKLPNKKKFAILNNCVIENFDYSWHPDDTEQPYIYQFGNNLYPAEIMPTVEYAVKDATQVKYIDTLVATLGVDKTNWEIPNNVDISNVDFKWKPNPKDPPYIYQFGTQHQKTGGPRYTVADATHIKYIENPKVVAKNTPDKFKVLNDYVVADFDYSWHPDVTEEPYIYIFGNNQYPPEIMPTIEYVVEGATQIKYVTGVVAKLGVDMRHWEIPDNIDVTDFDFSWKPNPKDPPLIYQFGTQWQKTGGPRYVVEGATEVKYVDTQKALAKRNMKNWTIPNHVDVTNFDFSWHPDDTSPPYIYHFATQWALTGGPVYKCDNAEEVKYIEFPSAIALPNQENWEIPSNIDKESFDFSWHPYVEDQPYIYQFGTQHQKTGGPRYITPGVIPTSPVKYIDTRIIKATRLPDRKKFSILNNYKIKDFDWSWHPDETDEPYIYVFGNTQFPAEIMPTIEYIVPGAKQIKYVNDVVATLDVDMANWDIPSNIDTTGFDFSWKPNPKDPPFIYQFGTQWQKTGGPRYVVPDATEVKYVTTQHAKALPSKNNWTVPNHVDVTNFDFSWHPDDTSPPYIYHFATQWALTGGPVYTVEGATETKYLEEPNAVALPNKDNWEIPSYIDDTLFDFSWHPYIEDQPYVYIFGTQHQKTGGPKYITPGVIPTSPVKYIDTRIIKAVRKQDKSKFSILNNYKIKNFDWSWHPDETDEPYIYVFGNTQHPAEIMPTIEYVVPGAKQIKYINDIVAELDVDMTNWEVPDNVDTLGFDFSWKPNPKDPPFIYQFGTQWQKTGGPRYVVPDATEVKYVTTQQVKALPTSEHWTIPEHVDVTNFDFSWHPDDTSPPYIYHFATQWALTGGPVYTVPNANEKKYLEEPSAVALPNKANWEIPADVDISDFDFSWHPYVEDQPYIYQFGTQWQKTGGPKYITPGVIPTSPIKYIDTRILKSKKLQNKKNFAILNNYKIKDFDYSWHPDATDEPYIYVFGNNQHPAEVMPTVEYVVPGAKQIKYVSDVIAVLDTDMTNWDIPKNIDITGFDFSWKPNPKDPPYIYEFGTQWQKTGGPRYVVEGATEIKYVSTQQAKALPTKENWTLPSNVDVTDFDFSWHPDATSPPYNYHFATQWALSGGPVYKMQNAKETKYMDQPCAVALPNKTHWEIPADIDSASFDFSWHPYVEDSPYIYQFGTQHQKTGGPRYVTPGAKRSAPIKYIDTRILKATKLPNRNNFEILNGLKVLNFDWSWHPDATDGEFIYVFGNNQYSAELMPTIQYKSSPYAEKIKYVHDIVAILASDKNNWVVPEGLDTSGFDFSWVPNPNDPPYIYQFGTQWQKTGGPKYIVPDATEVKYIDEIKAKMLPNKRNWIIPKNVDATNFDFSWHPDETEQTYIYEFGTQWQKTGGPKYVPSKADETTPIKYIDIMKVNKLSEKDNFKILNNAVIKHFDYSWHPDETDEPYIYVFGNNQYSPEIMPTVEYRVKGATKVKYVHDILAILGNDNRYWVVPKDVDVSDFDFSWVPNPKDPIFVYEFGTQWQKTGGPKYLLPNINSNTPVKYIASPKAKKLSNKLLFEVLNNYKIKDFDYSWHPDDTEEPYIYVFGNTQYPAELMPTIRYVVPGATKVKYINDNAAQLAPSKDNWEIPQNIDLSSFDFSWVPNPKDPPYIYQFGTQHQKTGGPTYKVANAVDVKYIDTQRAIALPNLKNWILESNIKVKSFDYSWHPDTTEEPYIYVFGNNQYNAETMPTVRYVMSGAEKVKYINDIRAALDTDMTNWQVPKNIDVSNFDFSWRPNPNDPPYIYQFGTQWQKTNGPIYKVPGAAQIKYENSLKATMLPNQNNFHILNDYDIRTFDYSWHPDETEEPYIYVFGNTQYPAEEMPTIEYRMVGATQKKYISNPVAVLAPDIKFWKIPNDIDIDSFDFSWRPNPNDPPFIYQFGTQHQKTGGPKYIVENANDSTPIKYIDIQKSKRIAINKTGFEILNNYKVKEFDYSWHPDETEEPFVYVFGNNQYPAEIMPTVRYVVPGATQIKYVNDVVAVLDNDKTNWVIPAGISNAFDYSWKPNPKDPPYIYQFGTQHQKTGGPKYVVPGATDVKYIDAPKAIHRVKMDNWEILPKIDVSDFDFSWHPDELAPPYIYQFGTFLNDKDGPRYITPNNNGEVVYKDRIVKPKNVLSVTTEEDDTSVENLQVITRQEIVFVPEYYIETNLDDLVKQHPNEVFWALNPELDYDSFDFSWRPNIEQVKYIHAFGSSESKDTQTYFVNALMYNQGYKDINYVDNIKLTEEVLYHLYKKPDLFFVDKGNKESNERFEKLQAMFGKKIQKTRYLNSWVDTINRCINRSTTKLCWILNSELDYSNFDFKFYPNPWQTKMVHVFGTQWSHWGTTFMVNRETFATDTKWIKIIEHLSNLNFVKSRVAKATNVVHDVIYIDHGNLSDLEIDNLKNSNTVVPYDTDYFVTFKNILSKLPEKKEHYIWIASTICDYSEFDFTYICDPFAREQLHVFPSDRQKFGDTFLVNVNKLRELINDMESLKDYEKINYNQHQRTKRLEAPLIITEFDSHVASVMEEFNFPYATFVTSDNKDIKTIDDEPMSLWDAESKTIMITSTGGTRIIAPREAKQYVETQLYDYPYIKSSTRLAKSNPMDIVYLSNGETCADENYEHLLKITKGLKNRIVRVDGVKGRVQAYHAAAEASNTAWMFTVFAKLKVNPKFDFNWQPDRLQIPKHYMFLAKNPVNGLIYGHQGMIAYNKDLVLNNEGHGLDFTLDSPHETIELLSGTALYNTDEFSTWRTAFREVIKLKKENSEISLQRLNTWLTKAEGDFAEYSIHGAVDGLEYYEKSKGKLDKLRKSYEWDWLKKQFNKKYKKK